MKILNEEGKMISCLEIDENNIYALSKERLQILKLLSNESMYAAEIARAINIDEQALHYHIKILQKSGFIKFTEYEEKMGGMAKKYILTSQSLAIILKKDAWKDFDYSKETSKLFGDFVENEVFNGKFIVGSPDPHGKYRARASEFPILELAMFLGRYATFSFPLYLLDTQLKEKDKRQNLIIAGGPKVNLVTAEINNTLPLRFDKATFEIYSKFSKKSYGGNIGVVELIENPFSLRKKILLIGGLNHHGTRAAVIAIIKNMKQIEEGNKYNNKLIAKVIEGFDENGDGIVDGIEVLE